MLNIIIKKTLAIYKEYAIIICVIGYTRLEQ